MKKLIPLFFLLLLPQIAQAQLNVTITSPTNTTYASGVPLEFSVNTSTSWIRFSIDNQQNITITSNTTLLGLADGYHNVTVYANDSSGNMGKSDTIFFTSNPPWSITVYTIPKYVTVNDDINLLAYVKDQSNNFITNPEHIVNYTADGFSSGLYSPIYLYYFPIVNFWLNITNFSQEKNYTINVTAYSNTTGFKGWGSTNVSVGNLTVNLSSRYYYENQNYTVSVGVYSGVDPYPANVSFKIYNSLSFDFNTTPVITGVLDCYENICNKSINMSGLSYPDIEFDAVNYSTGKVGGAVYYLVSLLYVPPVNFTIDKTIYKPGDVIKIDVVSNESIDNVSVYIRRPDFTYEVFDLPLTRINSTYFNSNYTLSLNAPNGSSYSIDTTVYALGQYVDTIPKYFDVLAWKAFASTDKYVYNNSQTVTINVNITDSHSLTLNYTVAVNITEPINFTASNTYEIYRNNSQGNSVHNIFYTIPAIGPNATYTVGVSVNDSYGRKFSKSIIFVSYDYSTPLQPNQTIEPIESLSVNPTFLTLTTLANRTLDRSFALQNNGNISAANFSISIPESIENIVSLVTLLTSIPGNSQADLTLHLTTNNLQKGTYSDTVTINSSVGSAAISMNIEIIEDISLNISERRAELNSLRTNITTLKQEGKNTTELEGLETAIENLLNEAELAFNNEDYSAAISKFQLASANVESLKNQLTSLSIASSAPDYATIIYTAAFIIIVSIVGIALFKFRHRVKLPKKEEKVKEIYSEEEYAYKI